MGWDRLTDYRGSPGHKTYFTFEQAKEFIEYHKEIDRRVEKSRQEDDEFIKNNPIIYV